MIPEGFDWKRPDYEPVFLERAERLKRIREHPNQAGVIAGLKAHYKTDPCAFISDWGITADPRNAERDLPVIVPFLLFEKQEEFVKWVVAHWRGRRDGLAEKSRDMGVSWLCVGVSVWMWLFHTHVVVGIGSRKEEYVDHLGDPKSLFWKVRAFIDYLPQEFKPLGYDERKHAPFMRILNPENGSAIVGEAGDNIGRGARTSVYFVDEAAFLEHPESADAALSQTSNCKLHVSTPNGAGNPFYRKRFGGKFDVFVFDWRDDPRKGEDWYAEQQRALEPHILAQEVDRDYEASVLNVLIEGWVVDDCQRRGVDQVQMVGGLMVGVDPARFGGDAFAVVIRRGRAVLLIEELGRCDTIQGAKFVKDLIRSYGECPAQIAVDEIGIGAGVKDLLAADPDFGPEVVVGVNSSIRMDGKSPEADQARIGSVTKTLCYNLRAHMWAEMNEWLKDGASLPVDLLLKAELCSVRYGYRGGSMLLESKEQMQARGVKSPNKADALALTFAKPVSMNVSRRAVVAIAAASGRRAATRVGY